MANYQNGMWFGNKNYMQWITAPQINYDSSRKTKVNTAQFTNGGFYIRRSATGARTYNFSWNMKRRDEIRVIQDYYDGIYGRETPIYFLDPFAMDRNVLPQYWATPSLGAYDAPLLAGDDDGDRPALVTTAVNTLGYPVYSAQYSMVSGSTKPTVFIPVPPDHRLWVGAHGTTTDPATGVKIIPYVRPGVSGTSIQLPMLSTTDPLRVSTYISGDTYMGGFLQLSGASGSMALAGIMAQVLPWWIDPEPGGFISGQGHSGCDFAEDITYTPYSAALDRVSASVNLTEIGAWL